ncbi:DUF4395 domain-containing protein [Bacillus sp. FJAT-45037]|uniref:DUF4395 domain-containing protein n=1 Tax=Bacillus sp. FJAT-45037 TaxID=2011007 RepID=UPI000C24DC30|nr:DUF4395 domain-containing protein [Bacillus sp. FJAT-45037]
MGIPKPLVQVNQIFLLVTIVLSWLISPWILMIPLLVGVMALLFKWNLIMELFKPLLRKPHSSYYPEDPAQQRFNQWIATVCLGLAIVSFVLGFQLMMFILSGMVVLAAGLAFSGYCIGCTIRYRYIMWKHQKN